MMCVMSGQKGEEGGEKKRDRMSSKHHPEPVIQWLVGLRLQAHITSAHFASFDHPLHTSLIPPLTPLPLPHPSPPPSPLNGPVELLQPCHLYRELLLVLFQFLYHRLQLLNLCALVWQPTVQLQNLTFEKEGVALVWDYIHENKLQNKPLLH